LLLIFTLHIGKPEDTFALLKQSNMFQTELTEGEKNIVTGKMQNVTHSNAFQFIDYTENYNW